MRLSILPAANINKIFALWLSFLLAVALTLTASRYLIDTADWHLYQFLYFYAFCFGNFFLINLAILAVGGGYFRLTRNTTLPFIFCSVGLLTLTVYVTADTFVYQLYRTHIDIAMLQMTFLAGGQVIQFSGTMMLQIFGLLAIITVILALLTYISIKWSSLRKTAVFVSCFAVGTAAVTNLIHAYAFPINIASVLNVVNHVPLAAPLKMKKFFLKIGVLTPKQIEESARISAPFNAGFNYPKAQLTFRPSQEKLNVIMIYVDTLRRDFINEQTAPNITEFSKNSLNFTNYISGGSYTKAGLFTLFYGLPANYWMNALSSNTQSVLVSAFQANQYDIKIFNSSGLTQPPFNQTIFSSIKDLTVRQESTPWQRDEGAASDYIQWLKTHDNSKPFFNFIFLDCIHGYSFPETAEETFFTPYWESVNHLALNNDFAPSAYINRYKNSLHYADKQIGRIITALKANHLFENSVIIVSADHGESFNEEKINLWGHGGGFTHSLVRIPLYIHWPGKMPRAYDHLASSLDMTATLLPDVLHCTTPVNDYSLGRSFWDESPRSFVYSNSYSEDAFIEENRIVIRNKYGILDYRDRDYQPLKDQKIPAYTNKILKDLVTFSK